MGLKACGMSEVDFEYIRNKNEDRVLTLLPVALREFPDFAPNRHDYEDIYALTLNHLPPRYVQNVHFILNEPVTDEMILEQLRRAVGIVRQNPNY